MTIRMHHPEHGWTHAYSEEERKALEKQGWQVEQPKPEQKPKRQPKEKK